MKVGIDARSLTRRMSGIPRYVAEMTRALADAGCKVTLYLPEAPHHEFIGLSDLPMRYGNFRNPVAQVAWGQIALPQWAAHDGVDILWGAAHRLPRWIEPRIVRALTIYDLVWVNAPETMRWQGWLADRCLMAPSVHAADVITTISEASANEIRDRFPDSRQRVRIVYPGLSARQTQNITPASDLGIEQAYALFVGTREPRKNLERLLAAYASLPSAQRSQCSLVIAGGDGWRLPDLQGIVDTLGISPHVRILGHVGDDALASLYANCRFLALPSLYEGFGLPLIEANAFGRPVLTSATSSMPEVGGRAALLVDPHDTVDIAHGLAQMIDDDTLVNELANNAKANAQRFNWQQSASKMIAVFDEAIASARRQCKS